MTNLNKTQLSLFAGDQYGRLDPEPPGSLAAPMGAQILRTKFDVQGDFAATAYQLNGEIIISYRGTTDPLLDSLTGWPTALGNAATSAQAMAAFIFYKEIVEEFGTNITLTGHSMGGALAGLVASVMHKEAAIFDHMPYGAGAVLIYQAATDPTSELYDFWLQYAYDGQPPEAPSFTGITASHLEGDLLIALRAALNDGSSQELDLG